MLTNKLYFRKLLVRCVSRLIIRLCMFDRYKKEIPEIWDFILFKCTFWCNKEPTSIGFYPYHFLQFFKSGAIQCGWKAYDGPEGRHWQRAYLN